MQQKIETGYKPRKYQDLIQSVFRRFNVYVLHRRFGKTVMAINIMVTKAISNNLKNPRYGYIAPTYKQAKMIAWDYLKDYTKNIPGRTVNEAELRVDIPRPDRGDVIRFTLLGAENPTSILGIYLDGVIFDEYGSMEPTIWTKVVRPLLTDRLGWSIFMGTPQGANNFKKLYDHAKSEKSDSDWISIMLKASETGIIPKSELEDAKSMMPEEQYEQEFECRWESNIQAAYFGKEMTKAKVEKRITAVPYEKSKPVHTYWDLGISDSTAIWFFQEVGQEFRLIDYHEDSNVDLMSYVKALQDKGYWYNTHNLPHDAAARELGTGKTKEETLRAALAKMNMKGQTLRTLPRFTVDDTINAAKMILNKCWFDAEKCKRGIETLENYQRQWDEKNEIWSSKPLHNWASHGADAFRMLAMSYREEAERTKESDLQRDYKTEYDVYEY